MNRIMTCEHCCYGIKTESVPFGDDSKPVRCVRYPDTLRKKKDDWCGEWKAKGERKAPMIPDPEPSKITELKDGQCVLVETEQGLRSGVITDMAPGANTLPDLYEVKFTDLRLTDPAWGEVNWFSRENIFAEGETIRVRGVTP